MVLAATSTTSASSTKTSNPQGTEVTILDPNNIKRVGESNDIVTRGLGAISLILMWIVWISGCISPFILVNLFLKLCGVDLKL